MTITYKEEVCEEVDSYTYYITDGVYDDYVTEEEFEDVLQQYKDDGGDIIVTQLITK